MRNESVQQLRDVTDIFVKQLHVDRASVLLQTSPLGGLDARGDPLPNFPVGFASANDSPRYPPSEHYTEDFENEVTISD